MKKLVMGVLLTLALGSASAWGYYNTGSVGYSYSYAPTYDSTLSTCDDCVKTVNLPWSFPYYGQNYSQVTIASNGFVVLGSYSGSAYVSNYQLNWDGTPGTPGPMIAPLWDDYNPSAGGSIYYGTSGTAFVVEWYNVQHYGQADGDSVTFELKLFADGSIEFHYRDTDLGNPSWNNGASATVGYQEGADTIAHPISYNSATLFNSTAKRYTRPGNSGFYAKAYDGFRSPNDARPSLKFMELFMNGFSVNTLYATTNYSSYNGGWGRATSSSTLGSPLGFASFVGATDGYDVSVIPMSASNVQVKGTYTFAKKYGFTPKPDYAPRWSVSYNTGPFTSKLDYWRGGGSYDKVVVFITGFDPLNEDSTASYMVLIGDLARQLLAEGYDVAIGKFGNGNQRLNWFTNEIGMWVSNAYSLQGGKVQVGGISMGGILLRDAIGDNSWGIRSMISAWYSIDSPQRGANMGRGYYGIQTLLVCHNSGTPNYNKIFSDPAADMMYLRATSCSCDDEPENSHCSHTTTYHDDYYNSVSWYTGIPRYALAFGDANASSGYTPMGSGTLYDFEYTGWLCSEDRDWKGGQRDCAAGSRYMTSDMINTDEGASVCGTMKLRLKWDPAFINVDSALGLHLSPNAATEDSACAANYGTVSPTYWTGWASNSYNEHHTIVTSTLKNQALTWIHSNTL